MSKQELPSPPAPEHWYYVNGESMPTDGYTLEQLYDYAQKHAAPYAARITELERELEQARAALIGSENARKDAERARGTVQSIDSREFRKLLDIWGSAAWGEYDDSDVGQAYAALIAYIDGRTKASPDADPAGTAPEWHPIETAPKDGSVVLLSRADAGGSWIGKYEPLYQSGYRPDNPWFSLMLNRDYLPKPLKSSAPTHWMHLPAAPTPMNGKEEAK